jgi:hypothetical protein
MIKKLELSHLERCWVLGTGPSLDRVDLNLLKNEVTIGCNKIILFFTPTYHYIADSMVVELYDLD